jgi:hypothetical protein
LGSPSHPAASGRPWHSPEIFAPSFMERFEQIRRLGERKKKFRLQSSARKFLRISFNSFGKIRLLLCALPSTPSVYLRLKTSRLPHFQKIRAIRAIRG